MNSAPLQFLQFPNGSVWRANAKGWITGTVHIPGYDRIEDVEAKLDAIADAATGSCAGLTGFSYQYRGANLVSFQGLATDFELAVEDAEGTVLAIDSDELKAALKAQYGWSDVELEHALANLDTSYSNECVLEILGSAREIRSPAHPAECSYVRVVADGFELAYWTAEEWAEDAAVVMGALIGAAKG